MITAMGARSPTERKETRKWDHHLPGGALHDHRTGAGSPTESKKARKWDHLLPGSVLHDHRTSARQTRVAPRRAVKLLCVQKVSAQPNCIRTACLWSSMHNYSTDGGCGQSFPLGMEMRRAHSMIMVAVHSADSRLWYSCGVSLCGHRSQGSERQIPWKCSRHAMV